MLLSLSLSLPLYHGAAYFYICPLSVFVSSLVLIACQQTNCKQLLYFEFLVM